MGWSEKVSQIKSCLSIKLKEVGEHLKWSAREDPSRQREEQRRHVLGRSKNHKGASLPPRGRMVENEVK